MLSEKQLNELLTIFLERMQSITEEYLIRMGEHIQDIGQLIPSDINRLVQLKRLNANMDAIKREVSRLAEISAADLEKIFAAAAELDARFVAKEFGNEFKVSILESEHIQQILKAQLNVTLGEMQNLSRTTIESSRYRQAVDRAIQAVQSGIGDYKSAIRRALTEAASAGLRITYPNGYSRRLDSAIRQNVLDGIRSLNNDILWQVGEEYGADGVEISAHALCAEDHLPYQGKQFSKESFLALQDRLPRPFGMWNCKHSIHPILLGVSESSYTEEELDAYKRNSEEKIEINGITRTRYKWTQQQRRIESAVRAQKDVAIAAQAAGDMKLRRTAQERINALYASYDMITEKTDIETVYDRMFVQGFKALSEKQLKNPVGNDKIESIKNHIRSEAVSKNINPEKQNRHVRESNGYKEGRSYIFGGLEEAQVLVSKYHGTGEPQFTVAGKWKNKELVEVEFDMGVDVDEDTHMETTTNRFVIHYSKTGSHVVPTSRKEEADET